MLRVLVVGARLAQSLNASNPIDDRPDGEGHGVEADRADDDGRTGGQVDEVRQGKSACADYDAQGHRDAHRGTEGPGAQLSDRDGNDHEGAHQEGPDDPHRDRDGEG